MTNTIEITDGDQLLLSIAKEIHSMSADIKEIKRRLNSIDKKMETEAFDTIYK